MGPSRGASPATLQQATLERIKGDIISGVLAPGTALGLEALRSRYGAGVSTLREVLSRLAVEGFVLSEGGRGFAVAPVSPANLREVAALRILLEGHAMALSFAAGDLAWEGRVAAAHHKLSRTEARMRAGDSAARPEWKRYDHGFHAALISACGSRELLALHRAVFDKYLRYQMVFLTYRGETAEREHRELLEAALARDVARARAVLVRHIEGGVEHALAAHARGTPGGAGGGGPHP